MTLPVGDQRAETAMPGQPGMQPRRRARETEGGQQEERRRRQQRQDGAGDAKPGGTQPEAKPENAHGGSMPWFRSCGSRRPQPDANKNPGGSLRRGSEIRKTGRVGLLAGLVGILLGLDRKSTRLNSSH